MTARRLTCPKLAGVQQVQACFPLSQGNDRSNVATRCAARFPNMEDLGKRPRERMRTHICSSDLWLFVRLCLTGFSRGAYVFPSVPPPQLQCELQRSFAV